MGQGIVIDTKSRPKVTRPPETAPRHNQHPLFLQCPDKLNVIGDGRFWENIQRTRWFYELIAAVGQAVT
jgi:hypothetical protein